MTPKIWINLPVESLPRSVAFFRALGYTFDAKFSNENTTCMIISDSIFVMLLERPVFATFTPKAVADATKTTEVLLALAEPSREAVDAKVAKALSAGGGRHKGPVDHGFMYQSGFEDPDGHIWEIFWMDPTHAGT